MLKFSSRQSHYRLGYLIALPLIMGVTAVEPLYAQATPPQHKAQAATPENVDNNANPDDLRPLSQPDSLLSYEGAQKLMQEATEAINTEKYGQAADKLQQARRIFNQLSNYYLLLANSFSGIDPKIVESQRNNALKTGQMRDEATYQLALVHRAQNKPELAVPLLIQVIQSQNPTSELGQKSYQQLYELGFVDAPYSDSTPSAPPASQK